MLDNTDSGFSTNGPSLTSTWTGGGGFEGADYPVLDSLNPPASAEIIDNSSAGCSTVGA